MCLQQKHESQRNFNWGSVWAYISLETIQYLLATSGKCRSGQGSIPNIFAEDLLYVLRSGTRCRNIILMKHSTIYGWYDEYHIGHLHCCLSQDFSWYPIRLVIFNESCHGELCGRNSPHQAAVNSLIASRGCWFLVFKPGFSWTAVFHCFYF